MKTHEVAKQLELLAKFLRSLPDTELEITINEMLAIFCEKKQKKNTPIKPSNALPKGEEERLKKMTPAEIEGHLSSEDGSYSVTQLQELAARLGVSTSKRQSKSALINLITRHFEASQMDSIIRSSKKDES